LSDAKWLLVGGWAVAHHGFPQTTDETYLWIERTPENSKRVVRALREFGFPETGLDPSMFMGESTVIRIGLPPLRIEIRTKLEGVEFTPCWERRVVVVDDDLEVPLIALDDLLANKRASGRLKDLADVEELEKRRKLRP
jgi:hypothetical protein